MFVTLIRTVLPFLYFKRLTHANLLKRLMAHKKNLILLLHLFINCISAKSTPQILSYMKDKL